MTPLAAVAAARVVTVIDVDMVDEGLLVVNMVGCEEMKAGVAMVTTLLLTEPAVSRMVLVIVLPSVLATTAVGVIVVNGSCCIICCGLISTVSVVLVALVSSLITPSTQPAEPCLVSMSNRSGETLSSAPSQERMRSEFGSSTGSSLLAPNEGSVCTLT